LRRRQLTLMKPNRDKKGLKTKWAYILVAGVCTVFFFFLITSLWIGYEVSSSCQNARKLYAGDCVQALTSLLEDEGQSYRSRNKAIWALGQLGDSRALSTLQKYYTGDIPDREALDEMISQYELQKAIALTSGGTNISAVIWKRFVR